MVDYVEVRMVVDETTIAGDSAWDVIEPVWWIGNIYEGKEAYDKSLQLLSAPQRLMFAIFWYNAEVSNGGHSQFYDNSTGIVWRDAMDGFEAAGIPEIAAIIEESARRMGGDPSYDREERWAAMERLDPDFGDLDTALYDLPDHEDRLIRYIRRNSEAFMFDGTVRKPAKR